MSDWDTVARKDKVTKREIQLFVNKAETNVPFFSKYFCNVEVSPKQKDVVEALREYQKVISVFNRQGGKTTIFGIYDSHELVFRTYPDGSPDLAIIFAPIKDQSRLIFSKVEGIMKNNMFLQSLIDKFQVGGYIKMRNGNELMAKTASPQAHIRGFSPRKIQLEESQDISDVKYYEDILPSGAATDARVQEIGTPAKRNHFWKTFNHDSTYKKIKQVWTECPFIAKEYVLSLLTEGKMTKARFDQEFNCVWNVDAGSTFPYELIAKMCILEDKYYAPISGFEYYAGLDVGKSPAQTVLSIGKGVGEEELYQQKLIAINNPKSYADIMDVVYKPLSIYEPLTFIDATPGSQGVVVYDLLSKRFTEDGNYDMAAKLVPFNYHEKSTTKSDMANQFEIYGENNRLKLINEAVQRRQLIAYEKKTSPSGNTVYFSEELTDICQADMMMLMAFIQRYYGGSAKFAFAASGNVGAGGSMGNDGYSFTEDLKGLKRPDWY